MTEIPIQELLPHRSPALLIDTLAEATETACTARVRVDPQGWYAQPDGAMPAWIGLELMAQTAAAFSGYRSRSANKPAGGGYLLGTRRYESATPAFPGGALLEVAAKVHYADVFGQSAFECEIRLEGRVVASATLKVIEKP
jgi:predicted hotdog family 3-hydroxylacyl-ACP dehydratase